MNCVYLHLHRKFYSNKLWNIRSVCYHNIVLLPPSPISDFLVPCGQGRSGQGQSHASPSLRAQGLGAADPAARGGQPLPPPDTLPPCLSWQDPAWFFRPSSGIPSSEMAS